MKSNNWNNATALFTIVLFALTIHSAAGQPTESQLTESQPTEEPVVGQPIPDYTFTNIYHSSRTTASISDYQGKWLFLEFWYPGCTSAVKSLGEVNSFKNKFSEQMDFLVVSLNNKQYGNVESIFQKLTDHYKLNLPVTYDSTLHVKWNIWAMPYIILVDPQGMIRHITNGQDMSIEKLTDMLAGRSVTFRPGKFSFSDTFQPAEFPGSPANTLVYRSILVKWNKERPRGSNLDLYSRWPATARKNGIIAVGFPLARLYMFAFTGKNEHTVKRFDEGMIYPHPVLELTDSSSFIYDSSYATSRGIYNYNLAVPDAKNDDMNYIKSIFQQDLKRIFGYNANFEKRHKWVWALKAKSGALEALETKGGPQELIISPVGLRFRNVPVQDLISVLTYRLLDGKRVLIEENETTFHGNIDIDLDAILTDIDDVRAKLAKHGLDIRKELREVTVLVISD